jgi:hypothetical protein
MLRHSKVINLATVRDYFFSRPKEMFRLLMKAPFARGLPSREILQSINYSPLLKMAGERCGMAMGR